MSFCANSQTTSSRVPGRRLDGLVTVFFTRIRSEEMEQDLSWWDWGD